MAQMYPRAKPGDTSISARLLNDTARLLERSAGSDVRFSAPVVFAKNDTGADLAEAVNVVSLIPEDAAVTPTIDAHGCCSAIAPDGTHPIAFIPACKAGKTVRAITSGELVVKVVMSAAGDMKADAVDSDTAKLTSGASGLFDILAVEAGTGEKLALVRFAGGGGTKQTITVFCITGEIIPPYGAMETYTDTVFAEGFFSGTAICVRRPTAPNLGNVLFNDGVQFNGGSSDTDPAWKTLTIEPLFPALVDTGVIGAYGTQTNSYELKKYNTGFMAVGIAPAGGEALVRPFNAGNVDYYFPTTLVGHTTSGWESTTIPCDALSGEWGGISSGGTIYNYYGGWTKAEWIARSKKTPPIVFDGTVPVAVAGDILSFVLPNAAPVQAAIGGLGTESYVTGLSLNMRFVGNSTFSINFGLMELPTPNQGNTQPFPGMFELTSYSGACVRVPTGVTVGSPYFTIDPIYKYGIGSTEGWNSIPSATAYFSIEVPVGIRVCVNKCRSAPIVATCSYVWQCLYDCMSETWGDITDVGYSSIDTPVSDWYLMQDESENYTGYARCGTEDDTEPDPPTIAPTCYYTWESEYDCVAAEWGTPGIISVAFTGTVSEDWDVDEVTAKATFVNTSKTAPEVPEGGTYTCYYSWRAAWDCQTQAWTLTLESTAFSGTVSAWTLDPYAYPSSYVCVVTEPGEPEPPADPTCYFYWSVAYTCADSSSGSFGTVTLMMVDTYGTASAWAESYNDGCNFYYECVTTSPTAPAVPAAPDCSGCV